VADQINYTHADLEELWTLAGGLPQFADTAAAIAQAESGGCLYAKAGPNDDRPVKTCTYRYTTTENSYGLWQINRRAHPSYSAASLYTPLGNAEAAVAVASGGTNFDPWTTYTDGAYKTYLTSPGSTTPPPGKVAPPPQVDAQKQRQVAAAWTRLMRTWAVTGPHQLRRVSAANAKLRARR
jgi:hypothetical protein